MTEYHDTGMRSDLEHEAMARVLRLVSGEATVDDVEDAKRWKQLSPSHADAFQFASRLWDQLGPAGRNVLARRGALSRSGRPVTARHHFNRRALLGGAAAALAVSGAYVAVQPPFALWPSFSELTADYRTATGEQRRVALTRGAFVELNTQTSIALVAATGVGDDIELINGEVAIDTGQHLEAPVILIAGDGRISTMSARFNVRYDGRTNCAITCLEGTVNVERSGNELVLQAGQRVAYTDLVLGAPTLIDPKAVTAWQSGLLVFRQTPLSEVIAEINRYRSGKIILMNADLGQRQVNARFRIDNVNEIMTLAQRMFGATVKSLPGGIVLLS